DNLPQAELHATMGAAVFESAHLACGRAEENHVDAVQPDGRRTTFELVGRQNGMPVIQDRRALLSINPRHRNLRMSAKKGMCLYPYSCARPTLLGCHHDQVSDACLARKGQRPVAMLLGLVFRTAEPFFHTKQVSGMTFADEPE